MARFFLYFLKDGRWKQLISDPLLITYAPDYVDNHTIYGNVKILFTAYISNGED